MVDCATLVLINLIENSSQFVESVFRHLLYEKLDGCLSQLAAAVESGQACHNGVLKSTFNFGCRVSVLEPGMLHGVQCAYPLGWVLHEHLSNQILQISTELLWHFEVLLSDSSEQVSLIIGDKR